MDGICTLANDRVYDQLVSLLNSIEAIYGLEMPVCVYPYNEETKLIAAEIARRPNVQLFDDRAVIQQWDEFAKSIWDVHPTAWEQWRKYEVSGYHRLGTHRRFCAFDAPFDRFVYMDADTLLMSPLTAVFQQLEQTDWVVYDFQYRDLDHVLNLASPKLAELFTLEQIAANAFCSGFYGAKKSVFDLEKRNWLLDKIRHGEAEVLYEMAPDQTILNYMVMRLGISNYNFARELPANERTGCCVTSSHFTEKDRILYDNGNRLTYIHYIGLASELFGKVCAGENYEMPYRDLFLHYRFLGNPEKIPHFTGKSKVYNPFPTPSLSTRVLKKLGLLTGG